MQRIIKLPVFGIIIDLNHGSGALTSEIREPGEVNLAVDGLESLIIAHACAGIDVTEPAYLEGIETAVEAIYNNFE